MDGDEEDFLWNADDIQEIIELDDESEQPDISEEMDDLTVEEDLLEGANGPDRDDAVTVFSEHGKSVFSVTLHPTTASVAVSGGEDDRAFVWNAEDGKVLFLCSGHKDSVTCTSFSHDGKLVATGDMSGTVKAWQVTDGKELWSFECGDLEWLNWHPLAHVLLAGTSSGELWMWKIPSSDCKTFQSHGVPATCGKVIPDGM
jgi:WD40 repeat protein